MKHKWHKEIKAWADGAEIEFLSEDGWLNAGDPEWNEDSEYRIKPQPKEPQYLYMYDENRMGDIRFYTSKQSYETSVRYMGKIKLEDDN